jgi:phosphate transport system permease protein
VSITFDTTERAPAPSPLKGRGERPLDRAFRYLLLAALGVGLVFLAVLLTYVTVRGWSRLDARLWQNFPSRLPSRAGAQSAIVGTIWLIALTALWVLPTGILTAIYLEEYADPERRINRIIELNIQNLAAVPSIVFGILGLGILARTLGLGFNLLTASLTLALLVLPVVIIASREAIRAVPNSIRLGSLALGATRWQTIWRQVLPAAVPGMATGAILALSRAMGEAAPLLLLGAATSVAFNPDGLFSAYSALPLQIYQWVSLPQAAFAELASAAIITLLVVLLIMNSLAIFIRQKFSRRW